MRDSGWILLAFIPVLFSTSMYHAIQQVSLAAGQFRASAWIMTPYTVGTMGLSFLLIHHLGIAGFAAAEFATQTIAILVLLKMLYILGKAKT